MIKSYVGPFIMTFFITIFILLMQFLWKYIDEFVGKGIELTVIAELLLYAGTSFIPMALPLAILLSSIMTFGNLGEHYELVALKSSGISLIKIMKPLLLFIIVLSISAFIFSNYYLPYANLKFYSLLFDVRQQRPEIIIKEGVFYDGIDNLSLRIERRNKKTNMMYDVYLFDHRQRVGNNIFIIADSGSINITDNKQYIILELYNGYKYEEIRKATQGDMQNAIYPHQLDKFDKQTITFELEGFTFNRTDETLFKEHYHMLNIFQLNSAVDSLKTAYNERLNTFKSSYETPLLNKINISDSLSVKDSVRDSRLVNPFKVFEESDYSSKKRIIETALNLARSQSSYVISTNTEIRSRTNWITKHNIQWHLKITLSVACIILFFIGAPLGAIIRKGGLGLPVVVSIVFFIFYYVISITGEKFAKEGVVSAWVGIWASSAILLPIGIFLTYKASRESSLFNIEIYYKYLNKITKLVYLLKKKKD